MELSIIFLPLIASIISGFFGKFIGDRNSEIVTSTLVLISAFLSIFVFDFSGPWKHLSEMAPNGDGRIFFTNPDLADILGRTDLDFDSF